MNISIEIKDFGTICRACLIKADCENLLVLTDEVLEMFAVCTSVEDLQHKKHFEDKLPQQICHECYKQLKTAYNFKQICNKSLEILCGVLIKAEKLEFKEETIDIDEFILIKNDVNQWENKQSTNNKNDNKHNDRLTQNCNYDFTNSSNDLDFQDSPFEPGEEDGETNNINEQNVSDSDIVENSSETTTNRKQKSVADILMKQYNIYGLSCNICHKDLSNRFSMLRHMKVHDQNRSLKYNCKTCNKGFYAAENLKKHEIRHLGKTKYQCDRCPKRFYVLSALGVHCKSSHKSEPIECPKCSQQFYHQLQVEQHIQIHEEKKFVCEDCGKIFPTRNRLTKHKKIHSEERPYKCPICTRGFKQKFDLSNHVKYRHLESDRREICNICGKLLHPGSLRAHLETHNTDIIYKCEVCNKTYANKIILGKHINQKHKTSELMKKCFCKVCDKGLGSDENLKRHMTVVHASYKRKECHICGKTYKSRKGLNVHIQSTHINERPHICETCNKAFHTKARLQNHIRSHTGERPFTCDICGKAFGFKQVLKTHMNVHSK